MHPTASQTRPARSRLRRTVLLVALAGLAGAAACDSVTEPREGVTGSWYSGDGVGDEAATAPMTLVLEQRGEAVTGAGSYTLQGRTVEMTVAGTIADRVVVLTLSPAPADAPDEILLQGMLSSDAGRITAALTVGTTSQTRVFERQ